VATSTQQLQQALARTSSAPKPISMEQIPEATIDVTGGTNISLDLDKLGVKKRKDQPLSFSSTFDIQIEETYGNLINNIDYNDPMSIEAFRQQVLGDVNNQLRVDLPDFESVKETPPPVVETTGSELGLSSDSVSETPNVEGGFPSAGSLAVSRFGPSVAVGAIGGASVSDLAKGVGTSLALGAVSPVNQLYGAVNNFTKGIDISNPIGALNFASNALAAGKGLSNLLSGNLVDQVTGGVKNVGQVVTDFINNPVDTLKGGVTAFSNQATMGTATPQINQVRGINNYNYVTDARTGKLAGAPGMFGAVPGIGTAISLGSALADVTGFTETLQKEYELEAEIGRAGSFGEIGNGISVGHGYGTDIVSVDGVTLDVGKLGDLSNPNSVAANITDALHGNSRVDPDFGFFDMMDPEEQAFFQDRREEMARNISDNAKQIAEGLATQQKNFAAFGANQNLLATEPLTEMMEITQDPVQKELNRIDYLSSINGMSDYGETFDTLPDIPDNARFDFSDIDDFGNPTVSYDSIEEALAGIAAGFGQLGDSLFGSNVDTVDGVGAVGKAATSQQAYNEAFDAVDTVGGTSGGGASDASGGGGASADAAGGYDDDESFDEENDGNW